MSRPSAETLRILDASRNRMREALRVIEDHLRFACDDADATAAVKRVRHDLQTLTDGLEPAALLDARAAFADVGRGRTTPEERTRRHPDDILRAAFARLTESARSFAEHAKLDDPERAARAERIRYAGYDLEQRILLRSARITRFARQRLYVILTEALCRHDWQHTVERVLAAGVGIVQVREKQIDDRHLLARSRALRDATAAAGALLIINDRPDIARLVGADGVHVGQEDLSVADVRRIAGGGLLVGKSTHSRAQFEAALAEAPDYLAIGPMYQTTTKPQDRIAGLDTLREVAPLAATPLVAIGGITPDRAAAVRAAGATQVCVCSAVLAAEDPGRAAGAFLAALQDEPDPA